MCDFYRKSTFRARTSSSRRKVLAHKRAVGEAMKKILSLSAFIVFTLIFAQSSFADLAERRAALLEMADKDNDGDVDADDAAYVDDDVDAVVVNNSSAVVAGTGIHRGVGSTTTVNATGATTNVNAAHTTANVHAGGTRANFHAGGEAGSPEGRRNVNQAQRSNNNTAARAGAHSRR